MTTQQYRELNESFRRRLIYHVGVDCGLFVELNYLINAMLYCLAHQIRLEIYAEDANFGTGIGWREYFVPFCEEVNEPFHRRYNFHRVPSWKRILRKRSPRFVAWKLKTAAKTLFGHGLAFIYYGERVFLSQDIPDDHDAYYCIPALGINGDYTEAYAAVARMIWQFQPELSTQAERIRTVLGLPPDYASVHIRGGDKRKEATLIDSRRIIEKLGVSAGSWVFVLTDDYRLLESARSDFPELHFASLCQPTEHGYDHQAFCKSDSQQKREAITRLILSVDLLFRSHSFVGSITTGPSVFVMKTRGGDPRVEAVDCPASLLREALSLTIDRRAAISSSARASCYFMLNLQTN